MARTLLEIADLLELKGENPFKIRAYRNAADVVSHAAEAVSALDEAALRGWNGIGKDLAGRIREIALTGDCGIRRELLTEFPATLLDVLRLQGVGPKTVAVLYKELRIKSLDDLAAAAKAGRIRGVKGMGSKKEQLILQAIEERQRFAGRHLLSRATEMADALVAYLKEHAPAADITTVGSVRRGAETSGDLDLLASGADTSLADAFTRFPQVERVLANGGTKASVLAARRLPGRPAHRHTRAARRGAAVLHGLEGAQHRPSRSRARARLEAERIRPLRHRREADRRRDRTGHLQGARPGLHRARVAREPRRDRSRRRPRRCPSLITRADLKGDLHMHTTESDGRESLETMVAAAKARGLEYIAITDHSQSLAMANGLDETRALANAERIRNYSKTQKGITVLAGIECDILADGSMDLADDCLASLDIVVASVHSALTQDEAEMTRRVIKAIEHPSVDIIGHLTGAHAAPPRGIAGPGREGDRRRQGQRRRPRNQFAAAPARSLRQPRAAGPRPRRQAGDRLGCALHRRARLSAMGNPDRPPGLGDERRRAQYPAAEAVQEGAAQKSVASPCPQPASPVY